MQSQDESVITRVLSRPRLMTLSKHLFYLEGWRIGNIRPPFPEIFRLILGLDTWADTWADNQPRISFLVGLICI